MTVRLLRAYAIPLAALGVLVIVVAGLLARQETVGVTRQPLPMVWPLGVLHVVVAQLPLRPILGPVELFAVRGPLIRALRSSLILVLVIAGWVTYVSAGGEGAFQSFFLILGAVGFLGAALSRVEPWAWTLGFGMAWVGLQFVTPLGAPMGRLLTEIPVPVAAAGAVFAACVYVYKGWSPPSSDSPQALPHDASSARSLREGGRRRARRGRG